MKVFKHFHYLGRKLYLVISVGFLIVLLGVVLTTLLSIRSLTIQTDQRRVRQEAEILQSRMVEAEQNLLIDLRLTAAASQLAEAVVIGDQNNIRKAALVGAAPFNLSEIDVVDAAGQRVFIDEGGGEDEAFEAQEDILIKFSLLGLDSTGMLVKREEGVSVFLGAVIPLLTADGNIVGALFAAREIDSAFLEAVNFSREDVELALLTEDGGLASLAFNTTGEQDFINRYVDKTALALAFKELVVFDDIIVSEEGKPHMVAYAPLKIGQSVQAVLAVLVDVNEAFVLQGKLTTNTSIVFFVLSFVAAVSIAFYVRRTISKPLGRLQLAAEQMETGDYQQQAVVTSRDEIGRLGQAFNAMAEQLQKTLSGLEQQVSERTRALATSAEVSRRLSVIMDVDELTTAVVEQLQAAFNYYHAHVYFFDETKENLVMAGGTGEAGRTLLAQGHKIAAGRGLVGRAAVTNRPVLVPDVSQEADWLANPLLPNTQAETAVPITIGDEVLGVLDVQQNTIHSLGQEDIELLQSIASQVAIAVQNARQYQQAQESEARTRAILGSVNVPLLISRVSDGKMLYANDHLAEVVRMPLSDLLEKGTPNFYVDMADRQAVVALIQKQGFATNYELQLRRVDGELFWSLLSARLINFSGEKAIFTTLLDITDRKQAEALLARQANELATVALVSTVAATILNPETLLQEVVDLTKNNFALYHAHIHLLNDRKDTLVLRAGAGEIGRKMVAEGRRIPLAAEGSLVATTARTRQGNIRNYDPPGEGFMPHPLLNETRCEMAVPIALGEDVLGVLDVRSDKLNHFTDADTQTYTALAAQIAVALNNAYSFARSEQAIKELGELSRRLTREGWESYFDQTGQDFHFSYDLHQVMKGKKENYDEQDFDSLVNRPIKILGEPIGQISVMDPQALVDDAVEIMDSVANRLSAHLENLRLTTQTEQALAETAEQARRRSVLNQIGEKLNRAENLDEIFQIAATGTAEILPSDRVSLALLTEDGEHFSVMFLVGAEENVPLRVNEALAGSFIERAVMTGEILVTHDVQPNPESGICSSMVLPLVTASGTIGTLNVGSTQTNVYDEADQGLILQVASLLSSIIENKRLLTETQDRAKELALINRVVAEVSASLDIKQSLQIVADELARAADVEAIGIALINEDKASLTVVAEYYNPENANSSLGYVIPIEGNALTQEVINTRRTLLVEDAQNNPLTAPVHEGMRIRGVNTLYVIPMFAGNEIVGTVGIDILDKNRRLSVQQLRMVETIIFQAATAVQNAQLYSQSEARAEELTLINTVSEMASSHLELSSLFESVGQLLCGTFAAESLYFALYDKKAEMISIPYFFSHQDGVIDIAPRTIEQGGYAGQIIASRASLLRVIETETPAEDMMAEGAQIVGSGRATDCYMGTPMVVGNEVVGVLGLSSYKAVRTYNEQDQRLLKTLADTIGVAVQNIRQFQAAQRQAEREAIVNAISQKIQAAPTIERALQTVVVELGQALKLKKAVVELSTTKEKNGSKQEVSS